MTKDEFTQYWIPARNMIEKWEGVPPHGDGLKSSEALAKKLGLPYPYVGHWRVIPLTDQLRTILQGITGPHYETLLKIYQIRREQNEQQRRIVRQKRRADLRQIKQDNRDAADEAGDDPSPVSS